MDIKKFFEVKIKRIKKLIVLKNSIKKMGGIDVRNKLRSERLQKIYNTKQSIKNDLLYSWRIKELPNPDKKDFEKLSVNHIYIPISFLNYIKKKYWGGNIYNEL